jgi:hypothetical protein
MIEFEISDVVVSLKPIEWKDHRSGVTIFFEPFSYFTIKGQGDLSFIASSNRRGFGFNVESNKWQIERETIIIKSLYFTYEEMQEIFIQGHEYEKNKVQIQRDLKIDKILD